MRARFFCSCSLWLAENAATALSMSGRATLKLLLLTGYFLDISLNGVGAQKNSFFDSRTVLKFCQMTVIFVQ